MLLFASGHPHQLYSKDEIKESHTGNQDSGLSYCNKPDFSLSLFVYLGKGLNQVFSYNMYFFVGWVWYSSSSVFDYFCLSLMQLAKDQQLGLESGVKIEGLEMVSCS